MFGYSTRYAPTWVVLIYVLICLGCERPSTQGVKSTEQASVEKLYDPPQIIQVGDISAALLTSNNQASSRSVRAIAIEARNIKIGLSIAIEEEGKKRTIYRSTIPVKTPDKQASSDTFRGMLALATPKLLQKDSDESIELELFIDSVAADRKRPIRFKLPLKEILESKEIALSDTWCFLMSPNGMGHGTGPDGKMWPVSCSIEEIFAPGKEISLSSNHEQTLSIDVDVDVINGLPTVTDQIRAVRKGKALVRRMCVKYYNSDEAPGRPQDESLDKGIKFYAVGSPNGGQAVGGLSMLSKTGSASVQIETTGVTADATSLQFEVRQSSDNSVYWTDEIRVPTTGFTFYQLNRNVFKTLSGVDSDKKHFGILVFPIDQASEDKE